ncbi:MAG TPA: DUF5666 domain-containing protein [Aggregatilineales bacterium]|nr:DUF5666 domain-containing protein [Aggregatilineales bacterium]
MDLKANSRFAMLKQGLRASLIVVIALALVVTAAPQVQKASAQSSANVIIDGIVQSINGNLWTVSGQTLEVDPTTVITGYPVVGSTVHIIAIRHDDGKLVALTVSLIPVTATLVSPTATGPTPTPSLTLTPSLTPLPGTPTATGAVTPMGPVSPMGTPVPYVTIIIEGPVEAIIVNVIVIYGQHIRLSPDDPVLHRVKIKDWVRVSGHFDHDENNQVIIVAIVVVMMDAPPIIIVPGGNGNGNGGGDDDKKHHHGDDDDD